MDWKRLPTLDNLLVQYLREKYPPVKYHETMTNDEMVRLLAIQHGKEELIQHIEKVISNQKKGG